MNYERHPYSGLFERYDLKGDDLEALAEDIQENGMHSPITMLDGKVLDGWNRYQACRLAEVVPATVDLAPGVDPWAFVKGANMLRRHMTPAERVSIWRAHERMNEAHRIQNGEQCPIWDKTTESANNPVPTVRQVAKELEVGKGTAERAVQIAKANDPALDVALAENRISMDQAAKIAKLPAEQRQAAIEAPPPPRPKPVPPLADTEELEKLRARVKELETDNEALKEQNEELARLMKDTMEENASINRILDSEDLLTSFKGEVKRFMELTRVTEARNTSLIVEVNELKGFAKSWRRKYERLAKVSPEAPPELEDAS